MPDSEVRHITYLRRTRNCMLIGFITHRLKCNRTLPCDSSIKRDKVSRCQYAANVSRSKPRTAKARDLRDRLDTLETVVSSFLSRDGTVHSQIERILNLQEKTTDTILLRTRDAMSLSRAYPVDRTYRRSRRLIYKRPKMAS
jgi:hypothetical protein